MVEYLLRKRENIRIRASSTSAVCALTSQSSSSLLKSQAGRAQTEAMAANGVATTSSSLHLNPILSRPTNKITPFCQLPLASLDSSLFGLRLNYPTSLAKPNSLFSLSCTSPSFVVTARYGGPRPSGNQRRSRKNEPDDESAFNISSIRSPVVRLLDEQQNMLGVMPKSEAIQKAEDAELDLLIVSPDADPPVVRMIEYSKYKYEQQKKKKVLQKKSAASRMDLKELKMGVNIDQHDYNVRLRAAQKFLKDGDKVKIIVSLKGRENEFRNLAIELVRRFQNDVGELATEESKSFHDRNIFITLLPNKVFLAKAQEPPKKKDKPTENEVSAESEVSAGV